MSVRIRPSRSRLLAAAVSCAFALPAAARPGDDGQDRFIVHYAPQAAEIARDGHVPALERTVQGQGLRMAASRRLATGATLVVTDRKLGPSAARQLMAALAQGRDVRSVEPDRRLRALAVDPLYAQQWHYTDAIGGIGLPNAWNVSTGSGVVVAVIDTGITSHTDLNANVVAGYDFITDLDIANDGNGRDSNPADPGDWTGADECGPDEEPQDSSWHGTHVAGTIAAVTGNGVGVAGVAYNAKVSPLRALGKCGGWTSDIADAIVWASGGSVSGVPANANPAEVINLSLGGPGNCDTLTQDAIDLARGRGSVVVVAAGNDNLDASGFSPASCDGVIVVGATGKSGGKASYSNYGPRVDVSAPGGASGNNVLSTVNTGMTSPAAEGYAGYQGTSMATPHVAALVALMQSHHPLSPSLVETVVKGTARMFPIACGQGCGTGIIDANAALAALDAPFLYIDNPVAQLEGNSGTSTITFTVRLSQPLGNIVGFDIATANGSAAAGSDYVAKTATLQTIPAGQTSKTFTVTVNGDATTEADETFLANVSNVTGVEAMTTQATATIVNDEAVALQNNVTLSNLSADTGVDTLYKLTVPAGATNVQFNTTGGAGGDADLYVRLNNSPTQGSDCTSLSSSGTENCTFATSTGGTYYVLVHAYTAYSALTLNGRYTAPTTPNGVLTIDDVSVTEGNSGTSLATFYVTLAPAQSVPVTVDVATADHTSKAPADYAAKAVADLTFSPGQTRRSFSVSVKGDTVVEANELFYVNLSGATNATIADAQGRATVRNDDGPTLSVADMAVAEGNSGTKTLTFTVQLSTPAAVPVTYTAATSNVTAAAGSDYVAKTLANETIPAGQTSRAFAVTINGDTAIEAAETFRVSLSAATGASLLDGVAIGRITDDDAPTLKVYDVGLAEGNSGTKTATFTVSLNKAATSTVTFTAATANGTAAAGSDYVARSAVESIPAGQLSKTVSVTVNGDTATEANETLLLNISNAANAGISDAQGSATIANDDGPNLRINDVAVTEGNSGTKVLTFTVSTPTAAAVPITYTIATANGTATAGSDYEARTLTGETIAAGQLSRTFAVTINGDATAEANEMVKATISSATGASIYDSQGIGTLTNDD